MPVIEFIEPASWRSSPWGNGQGTSHELARLGDADRPWLARASIADIVAPGPFTRFPGCQRWLAVIDDGGGLTLTVDQDVRPLAVGATTAWGGDAAAAAQIRGPARVWNLITRSDVPWTAELHRAPVTRELPAGVSLISALGGRLGVELDGRGHGLSGGVTMAVTSSQPTALRVGADPAAPAVVVHVGVAPGACLGGVVVAPPPPALVITVDGAAMTTWPDAHAELARVLGFPDFYGANLDALIDCLTYLDEPDAGMSRVHVRPGGVLVLSVRNAPALPTELYAGLADALAFVNFRRIDSGSGPVVALAAHR
ncbi:MAG: HutD family protein [Kofleriaceae bacterium]